MNTILIFVWIILGFISMSFWEAYIEGKYPWAARQVGWKKKISKHFSITAYHFWVYIMIVVFLALPLVVYGWNTRLLGIILSALMIGFIIEDFCWFIVNPFYSLKNFNPKDAYWYPWTNIGKFHIPWSYLVALMASLLSWYFLWR